jgi:hypothetical protein
MNNMSTLSFQELIDQLPCANKMQVEEISELTLDSKVHRSIMITVSSGLFRVLAFLHMPIFKNQENSLANQLNFDQKQDVERQYADYMAEMSNNLGGLGARLLGSAGFSTGLSQPAILSRAYSQVEISVMQPDYVFHRQSTLAGALSVAASFCLFTNNKVGKDIRMDIKGLDRSTESSGELELF